MIVEQIFGLPGIGEELFQAIQTRTAPVEGIVLVSPPIVVFGQPRTDLLYDRASTQGSAMAVPGECTVPAAALAAARPLPWPGRPAEPSLALCHPGRLLVRDAVLLHVAAGLTGAPAGRRQHPRRRPARGNHRAHLGTDTAGNDIMSRLLYGGRVSFEVGAATQVIGLVVGGLLGLIAGYSGRLPDAVLMRVLDVLIAFPVAGARAGDRRGARAW